MRHGGTTRSAGARASPWLLLALAAGNAAADPPVTQLVAFSTISESDLLSPDYLEASDALIGDIRIVNGDVFDLENPDEDGYFYRLMNALHIETRDDVIRRQLVVEPGDTYSIDAIAEAERLLRSNDFLASAEIVPVHYQDGQVDLEVITEDTWSLTPSISYSRKGGRNLGGAEIEESNLFGLGSEIKLGYKVRVERDELYFAYRDRQLGDSRLDFGIGVSENSDGKSYRFLLQQPFYALDTRRAFGVTVDGFDQLDPQYRLGDVIDEVQHGASQTELFYGWSTGLRYGWARRWRAGLGYDDHTFSTEPGMPSQSYLPPDRRDVYPFLSLELIENRYETTQNTDSMGRIEDRHIGARYRASVGFASEALGSASNALRVGLGAAHGFHTSLSGTLMLDTAFDGRYGQDTPDQYRLGVGARYYHQQSENRLFVAELLAETGRIYDTNQVPTLGGDTGLRGFPIAYQSGDAKVLLSLEQRIFTDWYPFRLFRIGGAAFFDAGRVWGGDPTADLGLLRDVGIGLRITSPRSSTGKVLHIDLAWPLDGPQDIRGAQLVIETRKSF